MLKCSKMAYIKCQDREYCGSSAADCVFTEGSDCDRFNQLVLSQPLTQGDLVRSMRDIELAGYLCSITDCFTGKCPAEEYCRNGHNGMQEYLQQQAEEG